MPLKKAYNNKIQPFYARMFIFIALRDIAYILKTLYVCTYLETKARFVVNKCQSQANIHFAYYYASVCVYYLDGLGRQEYIWYVLQNMNKA